MKNRVIVLMSITLIILVFALSDARNIFLGNVVNRGHDGYYVLDTHGDLYVTGSAKHMGDLGFDQNVAVDLEVVDDGYYILDVYGKVFSFGSAVFYGESNLDHNAAALAVKDEGYYILDSEGRVHEYGFIEHYGEGINGTYVDIEVTPYGYYLLKNNGEVEAYGDAVFYGNAPITSPAKALELTEQGYAILDADGTLYFFGNAHDLGSVNEETVTDFVFIPQFEGYYVLDCHGVVYSFEAYAGFYPPEYREECEYLDLELV